MRQSLFIRLSKFGVGGDFFVTGAMRQSLFIRLSKFDVGGDFFLTGALRQSLLFDLANCILMEVFFGNLSYCNLRNLRHDKFV
jgi:hypothetical protein